LLEVIRRASEEQIRLAHRLILAAGYNRAREAFVTLVRRSAERKLGSNFEKALSLDLEHLKPYYYYTLANLINLKRYSSIGGRIP
jgi:hypothetical protein